MGRKSARLSSPNNYVEPYTVIHISYFATFGPFNGSYNSASHLKPRNFAKERRAEREQIQNLLKESPARRDARNYLKQFAGPKKPEPVAGAKVEKAVSDVACQDNYNHWRLNKTGVNLGNLYTPENPIRESSVFTRPSLSDQFTLESAEPLHIALVKLRQPQALDDETLGGIALTLSQLVRLGLNIAVVVDCEEEEEVLEISERFTQRWQDAVFYQADRIVKALEDYSEPGAIRVDDALGYSDVKSEIPTTVHVRGGVDVKNNKLLLPLLEDGIIPVIPPIACAPDLLQKRRVQPDDVILALTRNFSGITAQSIQEDDPEWMADILHEKARQVREKPLLDRIIILDPIGGIPSEERPDKVHAFINLEQEYKGVREELQRLSTQSADLPRKQAYSSLSGSNPSPKFVEDSVKPILTSESMKPSQTPPDAIPSRHIRNLDVVQRALKLLPPSSSALIITPSSVSLSGQNPSQDDPSGVRTRRSKNPLIHNLLTDKPMISPSLPLSLSRPSPTPTSSKPPTFLKNGIPVTIIPDPRTHPWKPPSPGDTPLSLENDPRINFPRLLDLIEDSFQRKLDVTAYLDRIRGRIAGIIIAGNYEGGAICTWEYPPSTTSSSNVQPVPYLDKFAVLTRSQGSGGVADIVWKLLTRTCFPEGVVWRSRSNNPVNKWYFERSRGMWKLPGGLWTMFWTTEGVVEEWARVRGELENGEGEGIGKENEMTRWDAYVKVCEGVVPTWKDGKRPD